MICNEKLLKTGVTGVGKIKMQAEKEGTHVKAFPENITKALRALNTPAKISLKKIIIVS